MRAASKKFLGEHDFRNFCKIDPAVANFKRNILSFEITQEDEVHIDDASRQMFVMTITGTAFLWHQIRCITTVLFLIGQHLEDPTIIDALLDIGKNPRKPSYDLASEIPLVLWDCGFEGVHWNYDNGNEPL